MDLRRSSSFDQNQSREGRQERRDQTRFLKPKRSRSLPPDLEKYRIQAATTTAFENTKYTRILNKLKKTLLQLDKKMV